MVNILFHFSAKKNNQNICKILLENGGDPNSRNKSGETPLITAVLWGKKDNVLELINHGADTKITDNNGKSPEYYASEKGYTEILEILLWQNRFTENF